jgi:thiol-disulfide isomerase/thioredoxin
MANKITKLILAIILPLILTAPVVSAQESFFAPSKEVNLYFFWANGCPHCSHEKEFLKELEQEYPDLKIHSLEVTRDKKNIELLKNAGRKLNTDVSGVPFTVIGKQYFIGYNKQTTGVAIEEVARHALQNGCHDIIGSLITPITPNPEQSEKKTIPGKIELPLIGEMETKNLSLPALTIIIGALDGFNPCAMWVLLFLISLLLGMEDRKRMWLLGSVFIITSAFVYFLFMSAWLNLILFLGFIVWVRIIIGIVALIGGGHNLKEYFTNKEAACKVTSSEKRKKVFKKLKIVTQQQKLWLSLVGIIVLAFAVNLVELICSAGLPAVYVQILTLTELPAWQYYAYLILYIFIFMLDDLFVFFVAMKTLQIAGVTTKYTHASHLIGGIIMLIIGISLIFKPELLMFG